MPDTFELPGMLRAIVPLMRGERLSGFRGRIVDELVALALRHALRRRRRFAGRRPGLMPRFAAVVRTLDDLPEPAAGLRGVNPVRIDRRAFQMVDLPASKVGSADIPILAFAVRCQDECPLACTH